MRKGACFMEMASYLAGEKWSDHPACTHPLLAELARDVNDVVSDETRQRLAPMIPDVVGVDPADPRTDAWIGRLCAVAALPISASATQRVVAVGLLRCERRLARLEGRPADDLSPMARSALEWAPDAVAWARALAAELGVPSRPESRAAAHRTDSVIVRRCVGGIADACVHDPETLLVELLRDAIDLCRTAAGRQPSADERRLLGQR